jgi:hypothetical protein
MSAGPTTTEAIPCLFCPYGVRGAPSPIDARLVQRLQHAHEERREPSLVRVEEPAQYRAFLPPIQPILLGDPVAEQDPSSHPEGVFRLQDLTVLVVAVEIVYDLLPPLGEPLQDDRLVWTIIMLTVRFCLGLDSLDQPSHRIVLLRLQTPQQHTVVVVHV